MDLPSRGGRRPARRQTGVSQRGQAGFQRSRPPDTPHLTIGTTPPGSAGVPTACCPFGCRSVSLRCCSRPPCRREPHGPGRSRGRAPLPVDSGGGDGLKLREDLCGRDARAPGVGFPPMTGSHQRDKSAEAFWRQLVVEAGPSVFGSICVYSCPFVVRLHEPSAVFPRMIRPVRGRGTAGGQTGVSQRGQAGFQRSRPPDNHPPHHRDDTPGSAGVPPACCPFGCRSVSLRCCSRPPCRRDQHRPGRRKASGAVPG